MGASSWAWPKASICISSWKRKYVVPIRLWRSYTKHNMIIQFIAVISVRDNRLTSSLVRRTYIADPFNVNVKPYTKCNATAIRSTILLCDEFWKSQTIDSNANVIHTTRTSNGPRWLLSPWCRRENKNPVIKPK